MSPDSLSEFPWLRLLLSIDGIGSGRVSALINKYGSPSNVFKASYNSLASVDGIGTFLAAKITAAEKSLEDYKKSTDTILNLCAKRNFTITLLWDQEYPFLLKNIPEPPILLYSAGKHITPELNTIAIVGTRNPTEYGKNQAERLAILFAQRNITVVSGLARGIDSAAHRGTVSAGGRTIAVLGSGLDRIYPAENYDLAQQIMQNGLVITEFDPGTAPLGTNFPRRNRIISGLSLGCIVVESGAEGGAMHTARLANDHNREVFAVPGNIGLHQSQGPNLLIKNGEAKLITTAEDVISELQLDESGDNAAERMVHIELTVFEEKILSAFQPNTPVHIDVISKTTGMNISESLIHLLSLEFKGVVKQLPGKMFMQSY